MIYIDYLHERRAYKGLSDDKPVDLMELTKNLPPDEFAKMIRARERPT